MTRIGMPPRQPAARTSPAVEISQRPMIVLIHLFLPDCGSGPEPHGLFTPPGINSDTGKQKAAWNKSNKPNNYLHNDTSEQNRSG